MNDTYPDTKSDSKKDPSTIISAISLATALQTIIIVFLVALVVVCKYNRRKTTPRCPDMEDQLYETVNDKGVANKTCVRKEDIEINSYQEK